MAVVKHNRFDILLIDLDPTKGSEIQKTRPCVVISPNEMNHHIKTLIVAPMTSQTKGYPTRVRVRFAEKDGEIVLDQIRTIDQTRIVKKVGTLDKKTAIAVLETLKDLFAL
ncbi:MAG: type II toxin-antitoxin system PemK/MazF family toxin [Alphaproteobacteria bacterium]